MLYFLLLLWAGACAWQDAQCKRIANSLTFSGIIVGLGYIILTKETLLGAPVGQAVVAFLAVLLLMFPGYVMGKVGAADIKMLFAIALASDIFYALVVILAAGLTMALWAWWVPNIWPKLSPKVQASIPKLAPTAEHNFPYAPFALIGMVIMTLWRILI